MARRTAAFALTGHPCPAAIRDVAAALPYRLGLTGAPAVGWDALVLFELNREPTLFAAEDPAEPGTSLVSKDVLAAYCEAHHYCAIYWMTSDAVADLAITGTPFLPRLRRTLVRHWLAALTRATRDPDLARSEVRLTLATIADTRAEERSIYMRGALSPSVYVCLVQRKIAWSSCAARCLLRKTSAAAHLDVFRDAYDSWLFALQCRDDVEDATEDAGTYRTTVTDALQISPAALLAAGPQIVTAAVARAQADGFHRLARYLGRWLTVVRPRVGEPLPSEVEREAAMLTAAWNKRVRPG